MAVIVLGLIWWTSIAAALLLYRRQHRPFKSLLKKLLTFTTYFKSWIIQSSFILYICQSLTLVLFFVTYWKPELSKLKKIIEAIFFCEFSDQWSIFFLSALTQKKAIILKLLLEEVFWLCRTVCIQIKVYRHSRFRLHCSWTGLPWIEYNVY